MKEGDLLGVYFEESNPISFSTKSCNSAEERMRVQAEPEVISKDHAYYMMEPALSFNPCREYSLQAEIGNKTGNYVLVVSLVSITSECLVAIFFAIRFNLNLNVFLQKMRKSNQPRHLLLSSQLEQQVIKLQY